ncbi:hypothetical protein BO82DRAFT_56315 [Aspergillus uvarum CBS 121591]|uniref:Uncharacterized protein n=1 Tax=Aspergillus uvarum CBS 121591 TaxID=1448315 RepID=A0A319CVA0_9EURO|nr:hypothetical protein BO82DRAFT_56315 [Aspergillus uvarum CBS 121591]PYH82773.1 hypothetical protein BO82DRAFT_56315 [Aspergillus uvarum CBS 121591]
MVTSNDALGGISLWGLCVPVLYSVPVSCRFLFSPSFFRARLTNQPVIPLLFLTRSCSCSISLGARLLSLLLLLYHGCQGVAGEGVNNCGSAILPIIHTSNSAICSHVHCISAKLYLYTFSTRNMTIHKPSNNPK